MSNSIKILIGAISVLAIGGAYAYFTIKAKKTEPITPPVVDKKPDVPYGDPSHNGELEATAVLIDPILSTPIVKQIPEPIGATQLEGLKVTPPVDNMSAPQM